jgi:hypothetical protein
MTPVSAQPVSRFGIWIAGLQARADRIRDGVVRASADALIAHALALESANAASIDATLTEDIELRIWGWTRGAQWSYQGEEARTVYVRWRRAAGDSLASMRIDIDRFFPGRDVIGLDGVYSWIVPGHALRSSHPDLEPMADYIVARRLAWFATVRDGKLAVMDLYAGIRESVQLSSAAPDR